MGVASSKSTSSYAVVNEALSESISSTLVKIAQQSTSTVASQQLVKIVASAEQDVNISGITQKAVINVDVKKFIDNVSDEKLKSIMTTSLESTAKDNQEVNHQLTIGGSIVQNKSEASISSVAVNRIINSYTHEQFISDVQSILGSQTVDISAIARRDVSISNINQYVQIELIASQISKAMTQTIMDMASDSDTVSSKTTTQSTTSGFSLGNILIIIIIVVLIGGVIFWFNGGKEIVMSRVGGAPSFEHDFGYAGVDADFAPL